MRVIKNRVSLIKIVRAQCRFVFWVSIGLAAAVRKEIMKFINMLYIEQKHIQKKNSDKINVTKNTFFSKKLKISS